MITLKDQGISRENALHFLLFCPKELMFLVRDQQTMRRLSGHVFNDTEREREAP